MTAVTWPAYDSYNCDESLWLRNVPVDWSSMRLQHIATCNDNTLREFSYRDREIDYVDISSVDADSNTYTVQTMDFRNAPSRARRLAHHGDIVFSTVRPYLKAVATVANPNDKLVFSTGFAVIRPQPTVDPGFLGYVLRDHDFIAEVNMRSVGASYPAINATELLKLKVPFPPLSEQRVISAFLDEKCAKVDEAVRIKEEQIALLRERRQILIQEAVTRGLNPHAPMKDSGIDWIGRIPAHWEVENPKWLFKHRKERARKGEQQLAATQKYGVIPQSDFMEMEGRRVTQVFLDFGILKHVEAGDFVMSMRSFQGGLEYSEHTGCVSSAYVALEPGPRVFAPFYKYLFKSARYIEALQSTSNLVRDGQALRFDNFAMVMLPALPLEEQREIAEFLDGELLKSDAGISIKESQITALKEYKTTLINAAVTGKIKVA